MLAVFGLLAEPVMLAYSRFIETRADGYALDLFRDPATIVRMEKGLAIRNIADLKPRSLEVWAEYSHPPVPSRMAHARRWAAQHGIAVPGPLAATAATTATAATAASKSSGDSAELHGPSSGALQDPA